jgi:hypothetical protein
VNWRRAKNLLLISFLLLDLMLAWLYVGLRAETRGHAAGVGVEPEILAQLADNNITLSTELPRGTPELAVLKVGLKRQNPYPLALTFFGSLEEVKMVRLDDPLLIAAFSRGREELLFYSSGVTVYTCPGPADPAGSSQSKAEAEQRAREFLAKHGGLDELQLLRSVPYRRQGTFLVEFTQSWQGRPLVGASGAVLVVTPAGVENCWRRYLTVFGESGIRRSVIPAEAALLALALERSRPQATPLTVKEITLGYYNKIYNADEWEAAPVWRIWTGGDTYFYINAFTGELEAL